jgi:hypothetical protein
MVKVVDGTKDKAEERIQKTEYPSGLRSAKSVPTKQAKGKGAEVLLWCCLTVEGFAKVALCNRIMSIR